MSSECSVEVWLENRDDYIPVDVRAPIEYESSAIPGAINIPLFTNREREVIGTLYKDKGSEAAKWLAMETVSPKIPQLMTKIKEAGESGRMPLIYCWRGGMRSRSVAQFALMSGLHVERLVGGYRAFRKKAIEMIPQLLPPKAVILHGMTGTGKTRILDRLKDKGYPVTDLEGIANHKGSLFGAVDGRIPHSQKTFDALLFDNLFSLKGATYTIMEGESKRIGRSVQPEELLALRDSAVHIYVSSSMDIRIKRIYEEYVLPNLDNEVFINNVDDAVRHIIKRVNSTELIDELQSAVGNRNYLRLIELLIKHYYDPRYFHKESPYLSESYQICSDHLENAVAEVERILLTEGLVRDGIKQ